MGFLKKIFTKIDAYSEKRFNEVRKCDKCGLMMPAGALRDLGAPLTGDNLQYLCDGCYNKFISHSKAYRILIILSPVIAILISISAFIVIYSYTQK